MMPRVHVANVADGEDTYFVDDDDEDYEENWQEQEEQGDVRENEAIEEQAYA